MSVGTSAIEAASVICRSSKQCSRPGCTAHYPHAMLLTDPRLDVESRHRFLASAAVAVSMASMIRATASHLPIACHAPMSSRRRFRSPSGRRLRPRTLRRSLCLCPSPSARSTSIRYHPRALPRPSRCRPVRVITTTSPPPQFDLALKMPGGPASFFILGSVP